MGANSHVVLIIQHAMRMHHILLSFVACLALPYFSALSNIRHDFRKKILYVRKMCFDFLHKFIWNIFYFKKNSATYYYKYA